MNEREQTPPGWRAALEEYERRTEYGRSMGGEEKLRRRKELGLCNVTGESMKEELRESPVWPEMQNE